MKVKMAVQAVFTSAMLAVWLPAAHAGLPNHPPLYMNGKMGLTYFGGIECEKRWHEVSRDANGRLRKVARKEWIKKVSKYLRSYHRCRYKMRWTNFHRANQHLDVLYAKVSLEIPGGRPSKKVERIPGYIGPGESKWFTYEFKWQSNPTYVKKHAIDVSVEYRLVDARITNHNERRQKSSRVKGKWMKVVPAD